jgi:hypothetical protein
MPRFALPLLKLAIDHLFLVENYFLVVFKLVSPCFSIIYSAKKLPTAIAMTFNVFMSGV